MGFEIEDYETGERWQFACDSWREQNSWLDILDRHLGPSSLPVTPSFSERHHTLYESFRPNTEAQVDHAQLFDLFNEADTEPTVGASSLQASAASGVAAPLLLESTGSDRIQNPLVFALGVGAGSSDETDHEASGDATPVDEVYNRATARLDSGSRGGAQAAFSRSHSGESESLGSVVPSEAETTGDDTDDPPDALFQLKRLSRDLAGAVDQWARTLAATDDDCRALLHFFGLDRTTARSAQLAEGEDIAADAVGVAANQLLEALAAFSGQVGDAWSDLDKHRGASVARRRGEVPVTRRRSQEGEVARVIAGAA